MNGNEDDKRFEVTDDNKLVPTEDEPVDFEENLTFSNE